MDQSRIHLAVYCVIFSRESKSERIERKSKTQNPIHSAEKCLRYRSPPLCHQLERRHRDVGAPVGGCHVHDQRRHRKPTHQIVSRLCYCTRQNQHVSVRFLYLFFSLHSLFFSFSHLNYEHTTHHRAIFCKGVEMAPLSLNFFTWLMKLFKVAWNKKFRP